MYDDAERMHLKPTAVPSIFKWTVPKEHSEENVASRKLHEWRL